MIVQQICGNCLDESRPKRWEPRPKSLASDGRANMNYSLPTQRGHGHCQDIAVEHFLAAHQLPKTARLPSINRRIAECVRWFVLNLNA